MKATFKKLIPDLVAIIFFVFLSLGYFASEISDNKVLNQNDSQAGIGTGQEAMAYKKATGETTRWTNSSFGGMPTYQISPSYDSTNLIKKVQNLYDLFLPAPANLVFMMLLGFYILLRAFGCRPMVSALGAVMYALSSYFFILIQAGHIWKFITLAYIPPTIAGIVLAYNKKYLLGGIVTAFFLAMQILSNHMQMTYYFGFVIVFLAIAYFIDAIRKKELPHFFKASGVLIIAALIGVSINLSTMYHTYEYSKQTMRGKSELQQNVKNHTKNGLERDYIVQWSYGIGETFSLLVPNIKGGTSFLPMSESEAAMEKANPQLNQYQIYQSFSQYFGTQPITSGPVYVGAFVLTLFLLGLFWVKGPVKWALLAATILSILLSWGQNFMGFTDFFLDYIPMYNKFRAVSSILVIAEFTIPLLAILCVKKIFDNPDLLRQKTRDLYISIGSTAGICLLFALFPTTFFSDFVPEVDQERINLIIKQMQAPDQYYNIFVSSLTEMRAAMLSADAWRSLFVILIGSALLLSIRFLKLKPVYAIVGMIILCIVDLGGVDKRYLNDSQFVSKREVVATFTPSEADISILQDPDPNYRVLNFATSDPFSDGLTSYFHKSIGGYHAAKLRRYQDMINVHIAPEKQVMYNALVKANAQMNSVDGNLFKVINMLNAKYLILGGKDGKLIPLHNPHAYGNAWFVQDLKYVATPDEEIAALNNILPLQTAVVDQKFKEEAKSIQSAFKDSASVITLKEYKPNRLTYSVSTSKEGVVVFSEIYYPNGWTAYVDGVETPHFRADYILRAMVVPAGKHTIEFVFDPASIHATEAIAYGSILLLILGVAGLIYYNTRKKSI